MLKKWLIAFAAALMFFLPCAQAETVEIKETAAQMANGSVRYPQLVGMTDEAVQQKINDDIVLASGVTNHMITLVTLTGEQHLTVDYEAYLDDTLFSVVISARGKLPQKRDGHAYTAATYDLATGERVTLDSLFIDADAAVALMEEIAVESLSEELNGYLEYSDITPLPVESFTVDENGITFWYPADQFLLTSGYSGACQFLYAELEGFWQEEIVPEGKSAEQAEGEVFAGVVPQLPVKLGDNMQDVAEVYRLLRTPDEFPGGRYFVMEHPDFRGVMVISDSIEQAYENSVVEGLQLRRGEFCGMVIGTTQRDEWLTAFGEADQTIEMTPNMAYDYGLYEGVCDVYRFGENELRLYADTENTLRTIQICK